MDDFEVAQKQLEALKDSMSRLIRKFEADNTPQSKNIANLISRAQRLLDQGAHYFSIAHTDSTRDAKGRKPGDEDYEN